MAKKTITKFLVDMLLGELSKKTIAFFFGLISLPTLISLLLDSSSTILNTLVKLPIEQWQLSIWLFLSSFFLIYTFLIMLVSIKIHKSKIRKRQFIIFDYKNYKWKLLVQTRNLDDQIPLCPKHCVHLSVWDNSKKGDYYKCPFCEVRIDADNYLTLAGEAISFGRSTLDGHYKK